MTEPETNEENTPTPDITPNVESNASESDTHAIEPIEEISNSDSVTPNVEQDDSVSGGTSLSDLANQFGYENIQDDADAMRRLSENQELQSKQREVLEQQNRLLQDQLRYSQMPQKPEAPQDPTVSAWSPPDYDSQEVGRWLDDENNFLAETPDHIRQAQSKSEQYHREWQHQILTNPEEAFKRFNPEDKIVELIEKTIKSRDSQREQDFHMSKIREDNGSWLYAKDPRTGAHQTDYNGDYVMSPEGEAVERYMHESSNYGIVDPVQQFQYAQDKMELDYLRSRNKNEEKQLTAQEEGDKKRLDFMKNAANVQPSRTGSLANNQASLNKNLSLGEMLRINLDSAGVQMDS